MVAWLECPYFRDHAVPSSYRPRPRLRVLTLLFCPRKFSFLSIPPQLTSLSLELPVEEVPISFHAPVGQDSLVAPVLVPHGSLLGMPGRSLTLADFPPSSSPDSIESSPGEPYQRRFIPVSASPVDLTLGPCSPIGICPQAYQS